MSRRYEPMDLVVAIGMFATVVGAFLMFLAPGWRIGVGASGQAPVEAGRNLVAGQDWLQGPLEEAIVASEAIRRDGAAATRKAGSAWTKAVAIHRGLADSVGHNLDSVARDAARTRAEQTGRVQAVLGREIVNLTRRGIAGRAFDSLPSAEAYSGTLLGLVEATRRRMDEDFRAHEQPNLGRAIVTATRDRWDAMDRSQHSLDKAKRLVLTTELNYAQASGENQQQLGSLIMAETREQYRRHQVSGAVATSTLAGQSMGATTGPQSWPDVSIGSVAAASAGLLGLFLAGLRFQTAQEEAAFGTPTSLNAIRQIYLETVYPRESRKEAAVVG